MGALREGRRRQGRGAVCWYVLGVALVQLGLGLAVERAGPALRDPVFSQHAANLAARRAEAPDRPLLLALGSSRTLWGLDAGRITRADGAWLVYNCSDLGAGPMLEQVFLRRLLAAGVRPRRVLIEVVPMQLATGLVVPCEESVLDAGRLTWGETRRVSAYYRFPVTAYFRWSRSRALAAAGKHRELHDALRIDAPRPGPPAASGVGEYGYLVNDPPTPEQREENFRCELARFGPRLAQSRLAAGPAQAVRDLLDLCRREGLPFTLVLMPESARFRALPGAEFSADLGRFLAELQGRGDTELIDARDWVAEDGFWDPHHLDAGGAKVFSERFIREVLPRLRPRPEPYERRTDPAAVSRGPAILSSPVPRSCASSGG